jgi:hypothetical protein
MTAQGQGRQVDDQTKARKQAAVGDREQAQLRALLLGPRRAIIPLAILLAMAANHQRSGADEARLRSTKTFVPDCICRHRDRSVWRGAGVLFLCTCLDSPPKGSAATA